jgi:hypothetical protein
MHVRSQQLPSSLTTTTNPLVVGHAKVGMLK